MQRRFLLAAAGTLPLTSFAPLAARANMTLPKVDGRWRTFDVSYKVKLPADSGATRLWLPLPLDSSWQRVESVTWQCNAAAPALRRTESGVAAFFATWPASGPEPQADVQVRVATLNRHVEPQRGTARTPIPADVAHYLAPSTMIRTDGIVKETSDMIVGRRTDPLDKVQAIFDWVIDNSYRDAKVKGCGIGDIRAMLVTKDLGGKCADINALFVGLVRAAGVPARGVYGVRLAPSLLFPSMGARTADISRGQHCRAEFWNAGIGWVPADPADVRKAMLDDKLTVSDPRFAELRRYVFGSWEGNWMAFNTERDVLLPSGSEEKLNFFMYPEAITAKGVLDGIDPDVFGYRITSQEVVA